MSSEVDVFVTNYTLVDPDIYQLWIEGHSANEAVNILNQTSLGQFPGASLDLITSDVLDQYRTYSLLEKFLNNPVDLQDQLTFQLSPKTKQFLIEKFYGLDDNVVREFVGKKLSSKHRKDLDEVSEKTNRSLKSCRRQFDNVKRVFKIVEEVPGSLVQNIQRYFHLSDDLAKKYASIVFLGCMRFETSKRKLHHLTFVALRQCTEVVMEFWTYPSNSPEYFDTEMDKEFLLDLRELRLLIDKEKEHKQLVCENLRQVVTQKTFVELDNNFRHYSRAIVSLATALHRAREFRNLFVDLTNCLDYWRQGSWSLREFEQFLKTFTQSASQLDTIRERSDVLSTWDRYMHVISKCLLIMFANEK